MTSSTCFDTDENATHPLKGDDTYGGGDFLGRAGIEVLKQADIVVTNPPFSLFREYNEYRNAGLPALREQKDQSYPLRSVKKPNRFDPQTGRQADRQTGMIKA